MTHHAGKVFVFVLGACTISQYRGPNCVPCKNRVEKAGGWQKDLSLAGALGLELPWLMEMVYTVLPPGSHLGASGNGTLSAHHPACWQVEEKQEDLKPILDFFFLYSIRKNHSLRIAILFFKRSDAGATSITNRQTSVIICVVTLNLTSHCKYSGS